MGAHAGGMMVLHRKSGYIEYYNRHNSNLPSNNIYSIISDGYGAVSYTHLDVYKRQEESCALHVPVCMDV